MVTVINQIDMVILGALRGKDAAGIYAAAQNCAPLISLVLISVNAILGPIIARLYALGQIKQLQRMVTRSARIVVIFSLPVTFVFICFGHRVLWLFGEDFMAGHWALAILSIGQFVNAAMGSVGLILVMMEQEKEVAKGFSLGILINLILNILLIPRWGIEGAATATATSIIFVNILLAARTYQKVGIHTTALGPISLRKRCHERT
jgi:O-antigen/teichoic acid export membrane protein